MIDWLYTKIGVFLASMMLLVSLLSLLSVMNGVLRDSQAENIATRVAETIDTVGTARGQIRFTVSVNQIGERGGLPRTLLGDEYALRIFQDSVWVVRAASPDRPWRIAPLLHPVYTAVPPPEPVDPGTVAALQSDALSRGLLILPVQDFEVERVSLSTNAGSLLATFVHL